VIKSVAKAIDIMNAFSPAEPRLSLAEIARRLDLPKATAHNLLRTLAAHDFVEKTDDDRYALSTALIALTQAVRVNVELRDRAAPLLRQMADECRETVYLTTLDGGHALYIYAVESSKRLLARTAVGDRVPLHCTSVGKAMLSWLTDDEVEAIIAEVGLRAYTKATITDPEALKTELAATRARGYAIDNEEHEAATHCLGAPVFDANGRIVGACSISGTDPSLLNSRQEELSRLIMRTAHEISRRMGYVPSRISSLPSSFMT